MNHNICVGEEMSKVEDIQGEKGENRTVPDYLDWGFYKFIFVEWLE